MKIAAIGLVAATALLLAGCSGDPEPTAPSTTPDSTNVAEGPTSTGTPTVGNLDDPLCAAAQENITAAGALEAKTGDLSTMLSDPTFLTGDDATALNQWGEDMLTLTASTQSFYDLGVEQTKGEDINADFAALGVFVEDYSVVLAQSAADAKTPEAFLTGIEALFADADLLEAQKAAPAAAQNIQAYLTTRCDLTT